MSPGDDGRGGRGRGPRILRRVARLASAPWRRLRISESFAAIRRDFTDVGGKRQSRMRLDESGAFDLAASAFLHGRRPAAFEIALQARRRSTARQAWIFLALGVAFFLAWLWRLATMTWTVPATLTALQFTPALAVFFLLAFRFGLENYQIRMRRKVSVLEYLTAPSGFWPR